MINYEKITTEFGIDFIVRTNEDGTQSWIPCDKANSDYQRYLRWLENPEADESGTL